MLYRKLGSSDLTPSIIGFGCMSLGDDDANNAQLIHAALDLGVSFFDTADLYQHGRNEETLGKALGGRRDSVIVATKVGNQWREDGSGWDWNPSGAYIRESVHASLRRLGTDQIDLYQLHGGTLDDPIDEVIAAFEDLQSEGLIRYYGTSSIRPNVIAEWQKRSRLVSVMTQYSLLDRRPEEQSLGLLQESGVGVVVRGAVAGGLLVNKPAEAYLGHSPETVERVRRAVSHLALGEWTPARVALGYCLAHPGVSTIAAGIRTRAQLEDNVGVALLPSLSAASLEALRDAAPPSVYTGHRIDR